MTEEHEPEVQVKDEPVEVVPEQEQDSHTNVSTQLNSMDIDEPEPKAELPKGVSQPAWVPAQATDEEDPVEFEAPVFLNKPVEDLLVLQYPTRRSKATISQSSVSQLHIKPNTNFLETSIYSALPDALTDNNKGSNWGASGRMAFGGQVKPAGGRYAVTVWGEDGLHLALASESVQLQPQFQPLYEEALEEKTNKDAKASQTAAGPRAVHMSARTTAEQTIKLSEVYEYWREATTEPFVNYSVKADEGFAPLNTEANDLLDLENLKITE